MQTLQTCCRLSAYLVQTLFKFKSLYLAHCAALCRRCTGRLPSRKLYESLHDVKSASLQNLACLVPGVQSLHKVGRYRDLRSACVTSESQSVTLGHSDQAQSVPVTRAATVVWRTRGTQVGLVPRHCRRGSLAGEPGRLAGVGRPRSAAACACLSESRCAAAPAPRTC